MSSWYFVLALIAATVIWYMKRPVCREISRASFRHYFHEVLVASRKGAWIEILDRERGAAFLARKVDSIGQQISLELRFPDDRSLEGAMESIRKEWAKLGIECVRCSPNGMSMSVDLDLGGVQPVEKAAALADGFFDFVESVPGRRFRLRGSGDPDPEALRNLARMLGRASTNSWSKRWGKSFERYLDRRRRGGQ